ncbi:MAG: hypothetical protein C0501_04520 [Isosphaera sp.]|nr:hypothetical protein [Isosphaera sp.]
MRFRPQLQSLETRDTPSGLIPEFDPPPVFSGGDPGQTPGGDPTFGGPPAPPPPAGGDLGG